MDRISANILEKFSKEYEIETKPEDKRFEWLTTFLALRRHYSRSVDLEPLVIGEGGDGGIDGVGIIVNNSLVYDIDEAKDLIERSDALEVTFVFVQADRSDGFDGSKIGDFGFGVRDFFSEKPTLARGEDLSRVAAISDLLIASSDKLKRPNCFLYYWTTGRWQDDKNLTARRDSVKADLEGLGIFKNVEVNCFGADALQTDYSRTKVALSRSFEFKSRVDLPTTDGVDQAFLGFVPYSEFRKLVADEGGTEIESSVFFDNVRDWQEYNPVNDKIRETIESEHRGRFILMNNGVTIVARDITSVSTRFTLTDYQIVNGCQTSNVLFDQDKIVDDTVCIPLRLIATKNEDVKDQIIEATNNQTPVKAEQYFARLNFARKLEDFFAAQEESVRLYYERRDGQYDRSDVQKSRIITTANLIRAYAAVYLEEPHRTTRGYTSLRNRVGEDIFGDGHQLAPYFASAYALYALEARFKSGAIHRTYKPARYHLLLALRLAFSADKPDAPNARAAAQSAEKFVSELADAVQAEALFTKAKDAIDFATGGNLNRDHVRTIGVTEKILEHSGRAKLPSGAIASKASMAEAKSTGVAGTQEVRPAPSSDILPQEE
jgi:AIPR protein